jgi:hypothetical protein
METSRIPRRLPVIAVVGAFFALFFSQAAFAANSSVETYAGAGGGTQAQINAGGPNAGGPGSPGTGSSPGTGTGPGAGALPFTGLDLVLAAGGGLLLIGAGAATAVGVSRHS